jgi:hypothetical protein
MCAARPSVAAIQGRQHAVPVIEAGEQVKPRSAAGAADRPSREGTPTAWPDVRVKPGPLPERWPRASTRPRWPVDAPITLKKSECLSSPAQVLARRGGRGLVSQAVAPRRWASSARIRRCRARPASVARTSFIERPRKSRPSRPDFRWPHAGETSPRPPRRSRNAGICQASTTQAPKHPSTQAPKHPSTQAPNVLGTFATALVTKARRPSTAFFSAPGGGQCTAAAAGAGASTSSARIQRSMALPDLPA